MMGEVIDGNFGADEVMTLVCENCDEDRFHITLDDKSVTMICPCGNSVDLLKLTLDLMDPEPPRAS